VFSVRRKRPELKVGAQFLLMFSGDSAVPGIPLRLMAKDTDQLAGVRDSDSDGGLLPGLLAEERDSTRRVLWRIGSWAMAAVGAVMVAVIANQSSLGWRREQVAAADLARQAQQIQELARESQNEMRRLTSTIETLGNDRDRLSSRVTALEQGLESITGAIARQSASATAPPSKPVPAATTPQTASVAPGSEGPPAPQNQGPTPAPVTMPVPAPVAAAAPLPPVPAVTPGPPATTDKPRVEAKSGPAPNVTMTAVSAAPVPPAASSASAPPLVSTGSMTGPPDPAASKMTEPVKETGKDSAAVPASPEAPGPLPTREAGVADADLAKSAVQRTEFAIDLGSASSIGGLRALWRGLLKSNGELASLHPIIVVRESNTGLGMQLRLAAGPLQDAAAAAKICAVLSENDRRCETTVFDGQRLAMATDEVPPATKPPPVIKPMPIRHGSTKQQQGKKEEAPAKQETSLSSFFSSSSGTKH
jgi:hypothetical protein